MSQNFKPLLLAVIMTFELSGLLKKQHLSSLVTAEHVHIGHIIYIYSLPQICYEII